MAAKLDPETWNEEREYYSLVKRAFDVLAPFYDMVTAPFSKVRDKVVRVTNARNGSRILDVATGTGKQAFAFAKRGYNVIGVDLSEAMLKVANRKNKYVNAKFQLGDATKLMFEDAGMDVSCVSFALHDMPLSIREKALKEMARVTKPKGIIVVVDYDLPKSRVGRSVVYHFVKLYEGKYYNQFIESDLEALLIKSGIEIKEKVPALLGAARILKGIRLDGSQVSNT